MHTFGLLAKKRIELQKFQFSSMQEEFLPKDLNKYFGKKFCSSI